MPDRSILGAPVRVSVRAPQIRRGEVTITYRLGPQTHNLLCLFLLRPNSILPRKAIYEALHGADPDGGPAYARQGLEASIETLRALGLHIITHPTAGYEYAARPALRSHGRKHRC